MVALAVSATIDAPVAAVWSELERVEDHAEWMTDAVSIHFDGEQQRGVGTRISVATKVGPLRTTDRMEFVRWDPEVAMGVHHQGLVAGVGEFTLTANDDGTTTVTWSEDLAFPWFFGGGVGARVARPILARIWRGNLAALAARL